MINKSKVMNGSECKYSISRPYNLIDDSTFYKTCKDYRSTLHYRLSLIPRTVESKPSVPITIFNLLFPKWTKVEIYSSYNCWATAWLELNFGASFTKSYYASMILLSPGYIHIYIRTNLVLNSKWEVFLGRCFWGKS